MLTDYWLRMLVLVSLLAGVSGCGLSGDLYLEDDKAAPTESAAPSGGQPEVYTEADALADSANAGDAAPETTDDEMTAEDENSDDPDPAVETAPTP